VRALTAVVLALAAGIARAQPAETPLVALRPAVIEAGTEPVTLELVVTGAPPASGFSAELHYDDAAIALTSIELGDWPGSTGRPVQPLGPNLDRPGRAVLGALMAGDEPAPEGDGVLARLGIAGLSAGSTTIEVASALVVSAGSSPEPITARAAGSEVIVTALDDGAAERARAAATDLAARPRAPLADDFMTAVAAEATRDAEPPGAAPAPRLATYTPAGEPGIGDGASSEAGGTAEPGAAGDAAPPAPVPRRTGLALAAALAVAVAALWAASRRA
jgi:hypothetical protein